MRESLRPGIYGILDNGSFDVLLRLGQELFDLELCALQIRAKALDAASRKKLSRTLWESHQKNRVPYPFFVNDDLVLAKELGCGLHVGQDDVSIATARRELGQDARIGLSTHDLSQLRQGAAQEVDYFGYGPIYPTASKSDALEPRGLDSLAAVRQTTPRPIVAIGGLTFDKLQPLRDRGFEHFAMLSALHGPDFREDLSRFLAAAREVS